jgi:hypothetical protein
MRKSVCVFLVVNALTVFGLYAQKAKTPSEQPVNVCATVYNPTLAFVVPVDSRLVIEDATVSASLDSDEIVVGLIETTVGTVAAEHFVGSIDGADFRFMRDGRTMKVYGDPGTDVVFKVARRNAPEHMEICFTGHLEPADGQ